jgi:SWI/SNF-related matrix-associated actin-dependent regulator of chromatin subfamily D
MESSYRVKIEARLLDDDNDEDADAEKESKEAEDPDKMDTDGASKTAPKPAQTKPQRHRFSHFFKALTVDYDKSRARAASEQSVEWKKPERAANSVNLPAAADFDELTFKRSGDENVNITINLFRHEEPERFQLTPELADVVDMTEATRTEAVMGLWEYIKLMGLQEDEEKRNFRCDEPLRRVRTSDGSLVSISASNYQQVIGRPAGVMPALQEYINPCLRPLAPVQLAYTIRVDEEFHKNPQPTVYDVRVAVEEPMRAKLRTWLHNPAHAAMLKEIAQYDEQLGVLVQAIGASKAKHAFFTALSHDPANFVKSWLSSQTRDLAVIMGEAPRGGGEDATGDEWRRGGSESIWTTQNARESVNVLLSKQPANPR